MPAPRLLPDDTVLRRWVREGLSHQDIADRTYREYGRKVTRSAVSAAISRMGLSKPTGRYVEELPWRVRVEHISAYQARMLRLLGRRRSGLDLTGEEAKRLDSWLDKLAVENAVVAYDPDSVDGFYYVEREDGDPDGIPIRVRRVWVGRG